MALTKLVGKTFTVRQKFRENHEGFLLLGFAVYGISQKVIDWVGKISQLPHIAQTHPHMLPTVHVLL